MQKFAKKIKIQQNKITYLEKWAEAGMKPNEKLTQILLSSMSTFFWFFF